MRKLLSLLLSLWSLCPVAGGARLFDGTNDSLVAASVDLSAVDKITVSIQLYWNEFANDDDLALEFTADSGVTNGGFYIDPNASASGGGLFQVSMRSNLNSNCTFARPSPAEWHHYVFQFDSTTNPDSILVWVDGSSQSLTTNFNNGSGNFANSTLNFMSRNNTALFGAGRIAEVAIWPGILLSAGEITALAKGFPPTLVRPNLKPYYWPIIGQASPETDLFYGRTATVNGAVQTPHPRIFRSN